MNALTAFNTIWGTPSYPPESVDPDELEAAERAIGFTLPSAYRSAVLGLGLPWPAAELLSLICDEELDLPDLSEFHEPAEIASSTIDWREMGMPAHLVAFANDCSGNLFAFSTDPTQNADEVWFWDHDFDSVKLVADSFEAWLNLYNNLKR